MDNLKHIELLEKLHRLEVSYRGEREPTKRYIKCGTYIRIYCYGENVALVEWLCHKRDCEYCEGVRRMGIINDILYSSPFGKAQWYFREATRKEVEAISVWHKRHKVDGWDYRAIPQDRDTVILITPVNNDRIGGHPMPTDESETRAMISFWCSNQPAGKRIMRPHRLETCKECGSAIPRKVTICSCCGIPIDGEHCKICNKSTASAITKQPVDCPTCLAPIRAKKKSKTASEVVRFRGNAVEARDMLAHAGLTKTENPRSMKNKTGKSLDTLLRGQFDGCRN